MPSKPIQPVLPPVVLASGTYRCTGREAMLVQVQRLRCEADRLETLARELGTLSLQADEALWSLIHAPRVPLRS